jgi:hypothetical protein
MHWCTPKSFIISFAFFPMSRMRPIKGVHGRTAWSAQRVRKRPQATCPEGGPLLIRPIGHFRGGPLAGRRRVGHGGLGWNFRESMATPCHTPMNAIKGVIKGDDVFLPQPMSLTSDSYLLTMRNTIDDNFAFSVQSRGVGVSECTDLLSKVSLGSDLPINSMPCGRPNLNWYGCTTTRRI